MNTKRGATRNSAPVETTWGQWVMLAILGAAFGVVLAYGALGGVTV